MLRIELNKNYHLHAFLFLCKYYVLIFRTTCLNFLKCLILYKQQHLICFRCKMFHWIRPCSSEQHKLLPTNIAFVKVIQICKSNTREILLDREILFPSDSSKCFPNPFQSFQPQSFNRVANADIHRLSFPI